LWRVSVPGLDAGAVEAWLAPRLWAAPPLRFTRIGRGRSNLTYRVDDATGAAWVLRRPPLGSRLASAHDMTREHRVLDALAGAGMPVPRPLLLCDDPAVTGAEFYVMEHVDGHVLDSVHAASGFAPERRRAAAESLMHTLARLHALDVDAAGLGDFARRDAYAARQLRRWRRQWEHSKTTENPSVEAVADELERRIPPQRETALVHGDYRLDNVVVGPDGVVRAVLDWELATLGDPLADLGLLLAYTPATPDDVLPIHEGVMLLEGIPGGAELSEIYASASGRSLDALGFWVAFGYWKVAVILQGVHLRWREHPDDSGAGELEPTVARFIQRAEEELRR
jgi:aminoglycoside phosphotransferase (APT) family kinase protein